ncbi:hypothetical protein MTO96_009413 [Rhipicephalus appendiculatus]
MANDELEEFCPQTWESDSEGASELAQVASLTQAVEALANRSSSTKPTSFGQAPEAMDSAPSEHRDTAAHLAPLEARLGGLESQMASLVTTIEDRLAAALQTVFDRIPGMIVAQMPQLSVSTRRPKLKRVSRSQAPRPLSQVAEVDEQSSSSAATSEFLASRPVVFMALRVTFRIFAASSVLGGDFSLLDILLPIRLLTV